MTDLHCVCVQGDNHTRLEEKIFESGNWVVSAATADELIGGRIYLHEKQKDLAWHGGTILGWRSFDMRRKIFKYEVDQPFRIKCPGNWGQEIAIVRR